MHGISYGLFQTYLPVLTVQELAWSDTAFSALVGSAGLAAGILGVIIVDPLIRRWGLLNGLKIFLISLIALGMLMGLIPLFWEKIWLIQGFAFAYYSLRTFLLIALFTLGMAICLKPVAATQFALYMSISNLGISLGAALYAPLKEHLSFAQIFFVFALLLLLAFLFLFKVRLKKREEGSDNLVDKTGH